MEADPAREVCQAAASGDLALLKQLTHGHTDEHPLLNSAAHIRVKPERDNRQGKG